MQQVITKEVETMSKALSFLTGAWCCYCFMIGSYGGAVALLLIYALIAFDPFEPHKNKKGTTAASSHTQTK